MKKIWDGRKRERERERDVAFLLSLPPCWKPPSIVACENGGVKTRRI